MMCVSDCLLFRILQLVCENVKLCLSEKRLLMALLLKNKRDCFANYLNIKAYVSFVLNHNFRAT